jgi:hypothetical protein
MDILSNPVATEPGPPLTEPGPPLTEPEPPLTEAGQAALRDDVLSQLGTGPFPPGARISRSLWLILICQWGFRNPATLPVDDRLDPPELDNIASLCHLLARIMGRLRDDDETALVVLQ